MLYEIKINATSLGGSAPADGFIDPSTIANYYTRVTYTGTATSPTMVATDSFYLGDTAIVAGGTNLAAVISSINAKTNVHHFVASASSNKLQLVTTPGYDDLIPSMSDITDGVVSKLGFRVPVKGSGTLPTTKAESLAKVRGNIRWALVLESLQSTSNISCLVTAVTSGTVTVAPTEIIFLIDVRKDYYNYDFSDNVVYAELALKTAVAKALTRKATRLVTFYDPTDTDSGSETRPFGTASEKVLAEALTTTPADALDAVTVTPK